MNRYDVLMVITHGILLAPAIIFGIAMSWASYCIIWSVYSHPFYDGLMTFLLLAFSMGFVISVSGYIRVIEGDNMEDKNKGEWSTAFPTEPGHYWFYGYRFGKVSCGQECKKLLMLVKVVKTGSGISYVAEGNFMYKSDVKEALFQKATLPELPGGA